MIVLRTFVWGAILGVAIAVAARPTTLYVVHANDQDTPPQPRAALRLPIGTYGGESYGMPTTVVDVAAGVPAERLPSLVQLAPGEHVRWVGDQASANDLDAGAALASRGHGFVELYLSSGRRIVLLLH